MLYTIIAIATNPTTNTTNTTTATIDAASAKEAHEHVIAVTAKASGADVRVYPALVDDNGNMNDLGIMRGRQ